MKTNKSWGRRIITILLALVVLAGIGAAAFQFGYQRGLAEGRTGEFGLSYPQFDRDNLPQTIRGFGGPGLGLFSLPWLIGGAVLIGVLILLAIRLARPAKQDLTTVVEANSAETSSTKKKSR